MRFYSVSIGELRQLPIYTFWEMHKNIDAIAAEESLRMIQCISTVMNPNADKIMNGLSERAKGLVEVENKNGFDREGVNELKRIMGFK